jgi:hypothetical protein
MPNLSKADKTAKVSANEARRRKELALAELREMERDERRGLLVPSREVADAWATILASVKTAVLRIPDQCALPASATNDVREVRGILAHECQKILNNLANDVRQHAETGIKRRSRRLDATAADSAT